MKKFKITVAALGALMCFINTANAQEKLTYQKPSKEILDLVDVELAPRTFLDAKNEVMLLAYRDAYKSIEELSIKELKFKIIERRTSDQDCFIANIEKAENVLSWKPKISSLEGIKKMLTWSRNLI